MLTYNAFGTIVAQLLSHIFNSFDFDSYIKSTVSVPDY